MELHRSILVLFIMQCGRNSDRLTALKFQRVPHPYIGTHRVYRVPESACAAING